MVFHRRAGLDGVAADDALQNRLMLANGRLHAPRRRHQQAAHALKMFAHAIQQFAAPVKPEMLAQQRVKGDIDRMAEMVAHDVVCFPPSSWTCARYPRELVGREAFREAFKLRHINYIVLQSHIHFILVDGAEAVVHRSVTLRERGGGPPHSFDVINFLRFRSGSIVEFVELPDGSACDVVNNFPH